MIIQLLIRCFLSPCAQRAYFFAWLGLILLLPAQLALAEPADDAKTSEPAPKSPWKSTAELGFVLTSGNTETSNINAKFDLTHDKDKWRKNLHGEAFGASSTEPDTGVVTRSAERYQLSAKTDYKLDKKSYTFAYLNAEKDRFSGYDYQSTIAAGYGQRLIERENMNFEVEIGPGFRIVKPQDEDESEKDAVVRLGAKYEWRISPSATFNEDLSSEIASELTTTKSTTSLTAKINSKLAMKLSLILKNNSEVPPDTKETDAETAVTLVYTLL